MTPSKNNIHYRCGGTLHPEIHDQWVVRTDQHPKTPMINGTEILHRCDRCGLVGISVEPPR